jgi:fibronectin-binding autotransporter adhesin
MFAFQGDFVQQTSTAVCRRGSAAYLAAVALALAVVAWQEPACAQSGTWTAVSGSWSGTSNWSGNNVANGSGNTAFFRSTGTTTLDSDRTIGAISSGSGTRVIQGSGVTLTLATSSGAPTLTGTVANGTLAIAVPIAGTQGFQKTGSGALALAGANSFSGTAVLQSGTTFVQNVDALGAAGVGNETVVLSGAQMRITASGTVAESFVISGRGITNDTSGGGAIRAQGATVTLSGGITVSGTAEIWSNSSTVTLAGNTSGTGGLIFRQSTNTVVTGNLAHNGWVNRWSSGGGTLTLSGSNSYTGSTAVDSGPMTLGLNSGTSPYAIPSTTGLSVTGAGTGLLDLNGNDITIRTFGWRDDGVNPANQNNSTGGTIWDTSPGPGTTTITVTSGSFVLGTAISDGNNGRKLALKVATADMQNIELTNAFSTFSGGLTLMTGPGSGTRLNVQDPISNTGSPGAITYSIFGTGTVTVGLAPTDRAQFYMGPNTVSGGVGSTVLNDMLFNTAAGADTPSGVLLNATEAIFAGTLVAGQAPVSFATGSIVTNSVAVLTGRVTSADASGGLRLVGNGQVPGITVRLANAGTPNDYQGPTSVEANTTLELAAADQVPNGAGKGNVSVVGSLKLGSFSETINGLSGSGSVDGDSGTPTLTVGDGDASASFSGVLGNTSGSLSLVKIGSGVQTLGGANTYSGPTSVDAGTLLVDGDQSGATGAVTVASGATLGGSGTLGGGVTVNGILSPGNSPGVLTVPLLSLGAASTSLFEINGMTRGAEYDGVNISGVSGPNYGGTLSLVFGNGSAFSGGTIFDLFLFNGSSTGNFASVTSSGFYAGAWTFADDVWLLESGGQTLAFTQSTGDLLITVPEPSMLVLLSGVAVATMIRRRRR